MGINRLCICSHNYLSIRLKGWTLRADKVTLGLYIESATEAMLVYSSPSRSSKGWCTHTDKYVVVHIFILTRTEDPGTSSPGTLFWAPKITGRLQRLVHGAGRKSDPAQLNLKRLISGIKYLPC